MSGSIENDIKSDHQGTALKEAVMKEERLRWVCLQQRRQTPKGDLTRAMVKTSSETQTVTNGHIGQGLGIELRSGIPETM